MYDKSEGRAAELYPAFASCPGYCCVVSKFGDPERCTGLSAALAVSLSCNQRDACAARSRFEH